jgi:hypothetical protein
MKTKAELEKEILTITMKMHSEYPELSKYINEIPIDTTTGKGDLVNTQNLRQYLNSLQEIMLEYAKTHEADQDESEEFPGYKAYPPSEDIYARGTKEMDINPEDISKKKVADLKKKNTEELRFEDGRLGADLDEPGADLDDAQEDIGSEDEENNYYSIGGDNHNDLDED